jgi:hypothetical protein
MASANHDNNHILLSRKIGDPVAAAATSGKGVTSALRNDYLNRANKQIQLFFKNRPDREDWLSGLVTVLNVTFGTTTIPSNYSYDLRAYKDDADSILRKNIILHRVEPSMIPMVINREAQDFKNCYTIRGTSIIAYSNFTALSSGSGSLYYIKNDYRASAGDTADIGINAIWYETVVDVAALYHYIDKGEIEFQKAEERMKDLIMAVVGK